MNVALIVVDLQNDYFKGRDMEFNEIENTAIPNPNYFPLEENKIYLRFY